MSSTYSTLRHCTAMPLQVEMEEGPRSKTVHFSGLQYCQHSQKKISLITFLGGSQSRSGRKRKISLPREFDPRTVKPVASRYPGPSKNGSSRSSSSSSGSNRVNGEMKRDGAKQKSSFGSCTIETDNSGLAHYASFPNIKYYNYFRTQFM